MTGEWEVNIETNYDDLPDKIKSAFTDIIDASYIGTYEFIAYLGSKVVNDINHHAILAKYFQVNNIQNVKSIILMIYAEDSEGKWTSANDTPLFYNNESGINVVVYNNGVEDDALALFNETFGEITDVTRTAIALLATKSVDEGTKYYYVTEEASVADNDSPKSVTIVSILDTDKSYEEIVKVI